jgi:hypothetical protein
MLTDIGIQNTVGVAAPNPLPVAWLGLVTAPSHIPDYALSNALTTKQNYNLVAQIGYDQSHWDYRKVGSDNQLGRYQIPAQVLQNYNFLLHGSVEAYGSAAVNYQRCWATEITLYDTVGKKNFFNVRNLSQFLTNTVVQDLTAFRLVYDLYTQLTKINAVTELDTAGTVAGMISVAWVLGVGSGPAPGNPYGSGAWAWRYYNLQAATGAQAFVTGRYAVDVLSS